MTYGSLFAGIGGFDRGFERAGFETIWQVERDPFCRAVLATHWPAVQRFSDVRDVGRDVLGRVDCITAGVPCQDVSVAGKRAGLAGDRTGLFYEFARILRELRPAWFVFENVPGLLSSNAGRDFAEILRVLMVECRYGVAWRVLDSQFFGVAQRRRRVFVVGSLGSPCPAEVLFESESGEGNSQAGGETGQDVAFALAASVRGTGDGHDNAWNSNYIAAPVSASRGHHGHSSERGDGCDNLVATLNSGGNDGGFRSEPGEHIVIQDVRGHRDKKQHGIGISEGGPSDTLGAVEQHAIAFTLPSVHRGVGEGHNTNYVRASPDADGVRDFAGLPEGLDSARYRALGNAVTVQVAEWIARRIARRR